MKQNLNVMCDPLAINDRCSECTLYTVYLRDVYMTRMFTKYIDTF